MNYEGQPFKEWAGLLVIKNRRLLVIKEADKPFFFLPGGKVEEGESNEEAVGRETEEELGVVAEGLTLYTDLFEPSWSNGQLYRYRCFFGDIGPLPETEDWPGKTEAIAWINSKSESEENIKLGTIPQSVLLELLNDGHVD